MKGSTRCFLLCLFYITYSTRICHGIPTSGEHPNRPYHTNSEEFPNAYNKDVELNLDTAKEVDLILDSTNEVDLNLDTTKDVGVILDTISRVDLNLDTTKDLDLDLNRPNVVDLDLQTVKEVDLNLNTKKNGELPNPKVDKVEDFPPSSEHGVLNSETTTMTIDEDSSKWAQEETDADVSVVLLMKSLSRRMDEQERRIQQLSELNEKLVEDLNAAKSELLDADATLSQQTQAMGEEISNLTKQVESLHMSVISVEEAREQQHQTLEGDIFEVREVLEVVSLAGEEHRRDCDKNFEHANKEMKHAEQITNEKIEALADDLEQADHNNKDAFDRLSTQMERAADGHQRNVERIVDLEKAVTELESDRAKIQENKNYLVGDVEKVKGPTALGLKSAFIESNESHGRRYYLFDSWQAGNVDEAQRKCGSVNGYLAELNTPSELRFVQEFVRQHIPGTQYTAVYIGGSDEEMEGVWRYPRTGKVMEYVKWNKGQPSEGLKCNCVALLGVKYAWNMVDEPCYDWNRGVWFRDGSQRFVCEVEL